MKNEKLKNLRPSRDGSVGGASPEQRTPKPKDILGRTFQFAVRIVKLCTCLDEKPGVGRVLHPQILRAGTSVGSMIEEAQAAESRADFISKMSIGLKEARETHFRLRVLFDAQVIPAARLADIVQEAEDIKNIIGSIVATTKRANISKG